jgi:hypothetical protein
MERLLHTVVALQIAGFVLFTMWLVLRPDGNDPSQPFLALQHIIEKQGPSKAVSALGRGVLKQASNACRREACIQARFGGDRGRWLVAATAKGRDPCLTYHHAPCQMSAIRKALTKVLSKAVTCTVIGQLRRGRDYRLRVTCNGVPDFITVEKRSNGLYQLMGEEIYPGFLPRLYKGPKP